MLSADLLCHSCPGYTGHYVIRLFGFYLVPMAVPMLLLALAILFLPAFSFIYHYYLVKGGVIDVFFWVGLYFWILLFCLSRKAEELS